MAYIMFEMRDSVGNQRNSVSVCGLRSVTKQTSAAKETTSNATVLAIKNEKFPHCGEVLWSEYFARRVIEIQVIVALHSYTSTHRHIDHKTWKLHDTLQAPCCRQ